MARFKREKLWTHPEDLYVCRVMFETLAPTSPKLRLNMPLTFCTVRKENDRKGKDGSTNDI